MHMGWVTDDKELLFVEYIHGIVIKLFKSPIS